MKSIYEQPNTMSQERFLIQYEALQRERLLTHTALYGNRHAEEIHNTGKTLFHHDFLLFYKQPELLISNFLSYATLESFIPCAFNEWAPLEPFLYSIGFPLSNKILQLSTPVTARTLGTTVHIKALLSSNSEIFVFTRAKSITESPALVKVTKESSHESQRLFLHFGTFRPPLNEFVFFKKQELPIDPYSDEISIKVLDNGNDSVYVKCKTHKKAPFETSCEKFSPTLEDSFIFIAGTGGTHIKSLKVKYSKRRPRECKDAHEHPCCATF